MKRAPRRRGLHVTLTIAAVSSVALLTGGTAALASSSATSAGTCTSAVNAPQDVRFTSAVNVSTGCLALSDRPAGNPVSSGAPPLIFHGGPVMSTGSTGGLVITPIFWNPAGHPMDASYKSIITQYLADVAKASPHKTNVFSIATEYSGTDGTINYRVSLGTPVNDTNPLPANGCTVESVDNTGIYADNSGYDACLDDDQVQAQTDSVINSLGMPRDFAHIYVLYLPKHVESCFFAGATNTAANACTINHLPSAAYCAYHNQANSSAIYGLLAYPIYHSPAHFTCGSDAKIAFQAIESPNGNPDADTEVSPTSHEIIEAMTDPDTVTGWYDSSGNEIGDECAYVYGTPSGTAGAFYNQTINGHHYLTQEEFSNLGFSLGGGGCLQNEPAVYK